jgi:hypothetical protein
MRRIALLGASSLALLIVSIAPSAASAAFTQCPPVELDTGCQFLFTVTNSETTVQSDASQGPYEGADDALIGIVNSSSKPITSLPLSAEDELFGFEFDGICTVSKPAPGCVVLPRNEAGEKNAKKGLACPPETTSCGFVNAAEPEKVTFPEGIGIIGRQENQDPVTGYEGPTSWFSGISAFGSSGTGSGVINFSPALAPGATTYLSLESPPAGGFGAATTLSTTLSGGGQSGASISVVQGAPVTDTAVLGGAGAASATGPVSFTVFSDAACKTAVASPAAANLSGGTAGPSGAVSLPPGKYYWQASYAGNLSNQAVSSTCGTEVLTVLAATTTSTAQTGAGLTGPSLTVPVGKAVTDKATVAGTLAATSTGTVSYILYKDSKCTLPATAGSVAAVIGGVAGPSAPLKPKAGVYYWRASYSGDAANAPSVSACGTEVLRVALKAIPSLPSSKKCFSKRHFTVHPRAPRGVKLVSFEEQINGKTVKSGTLSKRRTSVSLVGLPKGTFEVELITKSSKGNTYEDFRTFHTCVPKKHKKHK